MLATNSGISDDWFGCHGILSLERHQSQSSQLTSQWTYKRSFALTLVVYQGSGVHSQVICLAYTLLHFSVLCAVHIHNIISTAVQSRAGLCSARKTKCVKK